MRRIHRWLAAALVCGGAIAACGGPSLPPAASAHYMTDPVSTSSTPTAMDASSPPLAPTGPYCASSAMRQGSVDSVRVAGNAVSFCAVADDRTCTRVHLDTGVYERLATTPPLEEPPPARRATRAGQILEADSGGLTVCTPVPSGPTHCRRVIPDAYDSDAVDLQDPPIDSSPDGARILFLRKRPDDSAPPVAELYSIAENRLLQRIPLAAARAAATTVSDVAWLGGRVYYSLCRQDDGTCAASLLDPATGRSTPLGIDPGTIKPAYFRANGSEWAFVSALGDAVAFADVDSGSTKRRLRLPAVPSQGQNVVVAANAQTLVLVYQAPAAGTLAVVDLARRSVVLRTPPMCAGATDAPPEVTMKLHAPPAGAATWPTRICVPAPRTFVVENDCGCNDALVCDVVRTDKRTLDLRVRKDASRPPMCLDCFPMVPARCDLPPNLVPDDADAPVTFKVRVNGAPAIDAIDVEPGGFMDASGCAQ
jgi:hypothetical protein